MKRKFITLTDVLTGIILTVLCAAALFALQKGDNSRLTAEISYEGKTERIGLYEIDTPYEKTVTSNGYTLVLSVSRDGIEVKQSDCPDKVCIKSGRLDRHGECAVCLPARLTVRVYGNEEKGEVDVIL